MVFYALDNRFTTKDCILVISQSAFRLGPYFLLLIVAFSLFLLDNGLQCKGNKMVLLWVIGSCFLPTFGKLLGQFFYDSCMYFFVSDIDGFVGGILAVIQLSTF